MHASQSLCTRLSTTRLCVNVNVHVFAWGLSDSNFAPMRSPRLASSFAMATANLLCNNKLSLFASHPLFPRSKLSLFIRASSLLLSSLSEIIFKFIHSIWLMLDIKGFCASHIDVLINMIMIVIVSKLQTAS